MKQFLFLFAFSVISVAAFSQTKRIAHRSHSGSDNSFDLTAAAGNFGLPEPEHRKDLKKLPLKDTAKTTLPQKPEQKDSIKTIQPVADRDSIIKNEVAVVISAARYFRQL